MKNTINLDGPSFKPIRKLSKRMVDDVIDFIEDIDSKPCWQQIPAQSKKFLTAPLPKKSKNLDKIYQDFLKHIFPYNKGNLHPRYWSWVQGSGTLTGAFADFLAAAMNPNVTIGEHAAMYVDYQVLDWSKEIMGFPKSASGMLLSGGSMANITALMVARNSHGNLDIRKNGLVKAGKQMIFYCSSETHACMQKAAEAMGLGTGGVKKIPAGSDYKIQTDLLLKTIKEDKKNGLEPFAIVANAGTVGTGAIDDLNKIADICKQEKLWFHVDGAYGAPAIITDEYKKELSGISRADSVAFDFHKWFYINYEVSCVLIRDAKKHRASFAIEPNYLLAHDRGIASGLDSFNNYGMELSRGFKALKVWMMLQEHGIERYKKAISQNISQAKYLADLVKKEKDLELMSDASLSIVCYRFNNGKIAEKKLNDLNKELLMQLQEKGIAAPSYTLLDGKYVIRACITNHRTKKSDLKILVKESIRLGKEIAE